MIVSQIKHVTLGLVLIVVILAEPGDRIPNHPNCPENQGPRPVYFVHPTNCSRFFECRQTDAWEFECSPGLHFNSKIDVCDYPVNAQCAPQSATTTTNPPTTVVSSTTTTPSTTTVLSTTVAITTEATPTYSPPTTPTESTTLSTDFVTTTTPNPTPKDTTTSDPTLEDTTSFYTTTEGTTNIHPTPEGTTTTYRPPSSEVTPLPECPPFGATHPNYWADGSDCSRYLGCLENCVQKFKCPDGLYWNDQQKQCDSFGSSNCCPVIPPAPNVWSTTTFAADWNY